MDVGIRRSTLLLFGNMALDMLALLLVPRNMFKSVALGGKSESLPSLGRAAIPVAIFMAESWGRRAIPVAKSLAESWSRR
eukprot:COSAG02_NODE_20193_length_843_cov_9.018817_1_plen_80_part_00